MCGVPFSAPSRARCRRRRRFPAVVGRHRIIIIQVIEI